jgi:tetratricopeptide (TPR) repeat protein/predicted Ser/Thr protein kinase
MTPPSLHERAGEVLVAALARPEAERDAFLVAACGGDEALLREVASLLLFHEDEQHPADASGRTAPTEFSAGEVFAGRFRMIARVGRGGMGDVWRADDLVLETPVALKLIRSADAPTRARIMQEVRLARQITHPAVCRVFDVGEVDDIIFYSMEFVRGEDLAALLKRSGRLTSDRVLEIARQLCAGLAAAHGQGVLHRDLKPANVLIDQDGRVQITDFGIAVTHGDVSPGEPIGTLGYMAPEQFEPGASLTGRTDLYALGVVLYELVTGQRHQAATPEQSSAALSRVVPDIHPQLARVIVRATAHDPAARPGTALEMAAALTDAEPARGGRYPWTVTGLTVVGLAAAVAAFVWSSQPGTALAATDTIIVADFLNTTGDPVFDSTLKVALAVALEQSPFLKVFPDDRAREDLRLMQRSPDAGISRAVAREIAQREQLKALIAPTIAMLGRNYVVGLEAIDAESGDVMARELVEVSSKEEVLSSLGSAVSRLRRTLGESIASIQRFDVPLPRATTPSLDALRAYALALDQGRVNPRLETIPHLLRAIELDPNFALAQAQLSGMYANTGQSELAPEWSRKAFGLRDRVSERERYFISWRYYRDATLAMDKALELARSWTAAYPRDSFAFNSLGYAARLLGQYQQAVEPFRESIRLDPRFVAPTSNLVATLTALNQFDDSRALLDHARASGIDHIAIRREAYLLAFINQDAAAMTRELDLALAKPEAAWASNWEPRVSSFGGRLQQAHVQFRASVALTQQAGRSGLSGQFGAQDALAHAVVGDCAGARREATAATRLSRDHLTLEAVGRALAWCGDEASVSALAEELAERFPDAILITRLSIPLMAAATAIRRGEPTRGLELLEPVGPFDHAPAAEFWPAYLRGEAHLQLGRHVEAIDDFRNILTRRGEGADSPLYPLAQLGLARALAQGGDPSTAREAYEAFFVLWKDADQDLAPLTRARSEAARLGR